MAHRDKDIRAATDITAPAPVILTTEARKEAVQITQAVEVAEQDQKVSADGPTELMQRVAKELLVQLLDPV